MKLLLLLYHLYKWLMRLFTNTFELQRICSASKQHTVQMTEQFERAFVESTQLKSLQETIEPTRKHPSKIQVLSRAYYDKTVHVDEVVDKILKIKGVKNLSAQSNVAWIQNMKECVKQMIRVNNALKHLTDLKQTSVQKDNKQHQKMLSEVWSKLVPNVVRSGDITDQWQMIGFQGSDPHTDFRGMGLLGLVNLHYFSTNHTDLAKGVLKESRSGDAQEDIEDNKWYGFAISGINFTSDLYTVASRNHYIFRKRLYTCNSEEDIMRVFNELYVKFFIVFHAFWKKENATVLDFNQKKDELVRKFFD